MPQKGAWHALIHGHERKYATLLVAAISSLHNQYHQDQHRHKYSQVKSSTLLAISGLIDRNDGLLKLNVLFLPLRGIAAAVQNEAEPGCH